MCIGSSRKTALLLEDNPEIETQLYLPSFDIVSMQRPDDALEAFRFAKHDPDIVILDINFHRVWDDKMKSVFPEAEKGVLPGAAPAEFLGIHVLKRLRDMDPNLPVVILTKYERLETAFQTGRLDAQHFLLKEWAKEDSNKKGGQFDRVLLRVIEQCEYSYDVEQRRIADKCAQRYRAMEAGLPGTVAYWTFEEEILTEVVRNVVNTKGHIEILDVGLGDGRFEDALFGNDSLNGHIAITGIDFSGKMLAECRRKFQTEWETKLLELKRCVAERLSPLEDSRFDVVIAGFGFLSYSGTQAVLSAIKRVAKPGAHLLLGYYNYDALFYEVWGGKDLDNATVPICGKINREKGLLFLPGAAKPIKVRPRTLHESTRELLQWDLEILKEWTFPTLYAVLSRDESKRSRNGNSDEFDAAQYHGLGDFCPRLYEHDKVLSEKLKNKGYYSLFHCRNNKECKECLRS